MEKHLADKMIFGNFHTTYHKTILSFFKQSMQIWCMKHCKRIAENLRS